MARRIHWFRPRAAAQQVNEDGSEEVLPRTYVRARLPRLESAPAHFACAVRVTCASPVTRTAVLLRGKVGVGRVRGAASQGAQRCRQKCRVCPRAKEFHRSVEEVRPRVIVATTIGRSSEWPKHEVELVSSSSARPQRHVRYGGVNGQHRLYDRRGRQPSFGFGRNGRPPPVGVVGVIGVSAIGAAGRTGCTRRQDFIARADSWPSRPWGTAWGVRRAGGGSNERTVGHRAQRASGHGLHLDSRRRPIAVVDDTAAVDPLIKLCRGAGHCRAQHAGHKK